MPGIGKGVLAASRGLSHFDVARFYPADPLRDIVMHYWEVRWALPEGEPYEQHTVPFPSVHVVLEEGCSEVVGPMTQRFTRTLHGTGCVFGAHLRPGMFPALGAMPMHALVDARVSLTEALGISESEASGLERRTFGAAQNLRAAEFDAVLAPLVDPSTLASCRETAALVEAIECDPGIGSAEAVAKLAGASLRSVQRRFRAHVGLSPKAVILRFRLIEAAERLASGDAQSAELAAELGYADQSHFVRAFRALTGTTPDRYAKSLP